MAKRRAATRPRVSVWNPGTLVNILAIPVLSGAVVLGGFYYSNRDVPQRLVKEAEIRAAALEREATERNKLRDALLGYADKTQQSISDLAKNAAVTNDHLKTVDTTLEHVVSGLQNIEVSVAHGGQKGAQ